MVAFFASLVVAVLLVAPIPWYAGRRPADRPTTWGEAMVGATYVFLIIFWVYGVVPHQFIQWSDGELGWRSDTFIVGPGEILAELPFDIPYTALRDVIVVAIYTVFVIGMVKLVLLWQQRGEAAAAADEEEAGSRFGRPLVRQEA